jgi:hypothetical protein
MMHYFLQFLHGGRQPGKRERWGKGKTRGRPVLERLDVLRREAGHAGLGENLDAHRGGGMLVGAKD